MPSLPAARIIHFTTRRLRIKIPEKRRDAEFFDSVANRLAAWNSVERVETNPLTASILVYFSDWESLFREAMAKNDLFDIDFDSVLTASSQPVVVRKAVRSFETADHGLRRWTHDQLDMRSAIFLLLLGGGFYQLLRGRLSTPAPTLLWYAGNLLGLWSDRPANATTGAPSGSGQAA
jgi:Heavy metal associated domain 2